MPTAIIFSEEEDDFLTDEEYEILLEDLFELIESETAEENQLDILELIHDEEYTKANLYY